MFKDNNSNNVTQTLNTKQEILNKTQVINYNYPNINITA